MSVTIMTILISFLSSLLAAFVTHYLATRRVKQNELLKYQIASYTDFIGAASKLAMARRLGKTEDDIDDLALFNNAKNKILISGNKSVVKALLEFWDNGATLEGERELLAFKRLCSEMRLSIGHKKYDIFDLRISDAMFKLEPSGFSFRTRRSASKNS